MAYWGDIDTWGLRLLANARQCVPQVTSLLMNQETYASHVATNGVAEPITAGAIAPDALLPAEMELYGHLLLQEKGRLEQEFIPRAEVVRAVHDWYANVEGADI